MDEAQSINEEKKLTNEEIEIVRGLAKGMHFFDDAEGDTSLSEMREMTQSLVDMCIKQCGKEEFFSPSKPHSSADALPVDAFEKIIGRSANEDERQLILRLQNMLGLKRDDALWALILALQYHLALFKEMPKVILDVVDQVVPVAVKDIREEHKIQREMANNDLAKTTVKANQSLNATFDELKKKATGVIATAVDHEIVRLRKQSNRLYISCVVTSLVFLILGATTFLFAGHRIFGG